MNDDHKPRPKNPDRVASLLAEARELRESLYEMKRQLDQERKALDKLDTIKRTAGSKAATREAFKIKRRVAENSDRVLGRVSQFHRTRTRDQ